MVTGYVFLRRLFSSFLGVLCDLFTIDMIWIIRMGSLNGYVIIYCFPAENGIFKTSIEKADIDCIFRSEKYITE